MKRLLVSTIGIAAVMAVLIVGACMLGSRLATIPADTVAMLGFEQNSSGQACWHDICPGQTSMVQVQAFLRGRPEEVSDITPYKAGQLGWTIATRPPTVMGGSWYKPEAGQIPVTALQILGFQPSGLLTIGDAIDLFGAPSVMSPFCSVDFGVSGPTTETEIQFALFFANGVTLTAKGPVTDFRQNPGLPQDAAYAPFVATISPWMSVSYVGYGISTVPHLGGESDNQPWHGFGQIESGVNC
jgi:hypothetical protein